MAKDFHEPHNSRSERPQCIVESDKESLRVSQPLTYLLYSFLEFLNTQIYVRDEKVTGSFDTKFSRYKSFQYEFIQSSCK